MQLINGTDLWATLQAAPLGSEEDILKVQLEVCVHARHLGCPEHWWPGWGGWVCGGESPEEACYSSGGRWSQAPTTKPEPPGGQCIYSKKGPSPAPAPMALFGPGLLLSLSLCLSIPLHSSSVLSLPPLLQQSGGSISGQAGRHACLTHTHTDHTHTHTHTHTVFHTQTW